jgi:hypothetical protein
MKRFLILASCLFIAGCDDDSAPINYLKIAGGGIVFNYRVSQASMIVIAQQKYPFPAGSIVEAQFDLPGTNTRQIITTPSMEGKLSYKLQSDPLTNIKKGGKYNVTIRLLDNKGKELDKDDRIFESDEDQSTLPSKPLVEGPALIPHLENLN